MKSSTRSVWFWRYLLALGIALAIGFLVDGKFLLLMVALVWIVAMLVSLARARRQRA
ncbi:MAG: hypothetical protein ACLPVF_17910 [Acidimicrobiales bacterium]